MTPTNEELAEALRSIEGLPLGTQLVVRLAADRLSPDGWIEWNGGDCPVPPNTEILVKYRSGMISCTNALTAGATFWGSSGNGWDIVAYRVVK